MSATRTLFVTGTDTGVGKTLVTAALLRLFSSRGFKAAGMKPVSSGSRSTSEGLRNDDALELMSCASVSAPYSIVNPYCFEPAIAPHIAADQAGIPIEMAKLREAYEELRTQAQIVVVEGAGGWLTPIGPEETLADFAASIGAQVILVVGMRLGCINHACLTAQSIRSAGVTLQGWIANTIEPQMPRLAENIAALKARLPAPLLGVIPYRERPTAGETAGLLSIG